MGRKLRHLLIFLLIILKEPNMPEADLSTSLVGNTELESNIRPTAGPVTSVTQPLASQSEKSTSSVGNTESNARPTAGPVTSVTQPLVSQSEKSTSSVGNTENNGRPTAGPVTSVTQTRARVSQSEMSTSSVGNTESNARPTAGPVTSVTQPLASQSEKSTSSVGNTESNARPTAGPVTSVTQPLVSQSERSTSSVGNTESNARPTAGPVTSVTQPLASQSETSTSSVGNTESNAGPTAGPVTSVTQPLVSQSERSTSSVEDVGNTESNARPIAGPVTSATQPPVSQSEMSTSSVGNTESNARPLAHPVGLVSTTQALFINSLESANYSYNATVFSRYHTADSTAKTTHPAGSTGETMSTLIAPLAVTSDKPKSVPRFPLLPVIGSVCGIVLVGTTILVVWYKMKYRHVPLGLNHNASSNTNAAASVLNSDHIQTGQGQCQANIQCLKVDNLSYGQVLAALKENPMYEGLGTTPKDLLVSTELASQSGQRQNNSEASTNITATVMTSDHDQIGQSRSQAITESNTNTKATVMTMRQGRKGIRPSSV
ncbi:hypothetical protein Bbelb_280340 [Branchiostoma belcheri]|nr:hypothetical protein Bbelb_280340 [Branchiostoma belcheri]